MLRIFITASLITILACESQDTPKPDPIVIEPPKEIKYVLSKDLLWSDEFDKDGAPDPTKWGYDLGGGGWGNNEKQFYTNERKNSRVENGNLVIEALKESTGYTSARLLSKNKGDFLYGRVEIRAKLPTGVGTWPAAWMLATDQVYGSAYWPDNGEIDIIEHVGFDQDRVHGNIHTKAFHHSIGTNKGNSVMVSGASSGFHIYAMEWWPDKVSIEVDKDVYFTFPNTKAGWEQWPFDKKMFILLNLAIGGNWGGQKGIDDTIFPQKYLVDYVRIYPIVKE